MSDSFTLSPSQALNTYVSSAKRFVDAGQFNEAKEILKKGEVVYPYSADIQFMYAQAAFGTKDDETAAQKLNAAAKLAPAYINAAFDEIKVEAGLKADGLLSLGWGLYYARQSEKAIERFNGMEIATGREENFDYGDFAYVLELENRKPSAPTLSRRGKGRSFRRR